MPPACRRARHERRGHPHRHTTNATRRARACGHGTAGGERLCKASAGLTAFATGGKRSPWSHCQLQLGAGTRVGHAGGGGASAVSLRRAPAAGGSGRVAPALGQAFEQCMPVQVGDGRQQIGCRSSTAACRSRSSGLTSRRKSNLSPPVCSHSARCATACAAAAVAVSRHAAQLATLRRPRTATHGPQRLCWRLRIHEPVQPSRAAWACHREQGGIRRCGVAQPCGHRHRLAGLSFASDAPKGPPS